jgi:hypothetical protein
MIYHKRIINETPTPGSIVTVLTIVGACPVWIEVGEFGSVLTEF